MTYRRFRLLLLAAMGRGYPPVIFIEAGEDPTKNRLPMIAPINIGLIITIAVLACATPTLALGMYPIFFPPKPTATPTITPTMEGTIDATAEATSEPTFTPEPSPVIVVVTATPTITETPAPTSTPTFTPTPTATAERWPIEMTATQLKEELLLTQASTPGILPRYIIVTPTEAR